MGRHHIIMADIVGSSGYRREASRLVKRFRLIVDRVNAALDDRLLSPLTITLGDEFQGVAAGLGSACEALLAVEEQRIRDGLSFELRFVIHHGPIDTPIRSDRAHGMLGEGLTDARRTLAQLKRDKRRFDLSIAPSPRAEALRDALTLLFAIVDRWKGRDVEVIEAYLDGLDYQDAAKRLGRDRSSVWRRYRSLQLREYDAAVRLVRYLSGSSPPCSPSRSSTACRSR